MPWDNVAVIRLQLGRHGIYGIKNSEQVPLAAARILRNVTLEDNTYRTMGGATSLGSAIGAQVNAAIDFFPSDGTQRTLVSVGDGSLRKDDGNGDNWVTLASGLTTSGQVPFWCLAGAESQGRSRKAFHCDRINSVRVLAADGVTMSAIASPPADWNGTNQPAWLCQHRGYLWGGGNVNDPRRAYRSLLQDHENFGGGGAGPGYQIPILMGDYERQVAAMSYKGFLLIWCYPRGVFAIDTRSDQEVQWAPFEVGQAGAAGPWNVIRLEDDVLWVSPQGTFHLISQTDAAGSLRATDISAEKLGAFFRDNVNLAQLATAQWIYYAHKGVASLACHGQGQTAKNRRLDFDVLKAKEIGERWVFQERDRNEALYIRKESEIGVPAMFDEDGLLWELDRSSRTQDGSGYSMTWEIWDSDFAQLVPEWASRKKNGRFLAILYDPKTASTHTIDVIRDGDIRQSIDFSLKAGGVTLPVTLPVTLTESVPTLTAKKRLLGQFTRLGLKGRSAGAGNDVSLMELQIGVELAG